MATEVILPKLGQTMEEGAIVEWVKEEGDPVKRGDVLFTVESDKAVLEVEATARGFLRKVLVPAGQTVPVLTAVALITRQADEDVSSRGAPGPVAQPTEPAGDELDAESAATGPILPEDAAAHPSAPQRIFASPRARKTAREKGVDLALVVGTGPGGRIVERDVLSYEASQPKSTPVAVKMAGSLGVDLAAVKGTGPGGRITKEDVVAAATPVAAGPPASVPTPAAPTLPAAPVTKAALLADAEALAAEAVALTGLRRIIAERMLASDTQTARVTLVTEADATDFVEAREKLKASVSDEWGFAPGYNDLLGLMVARALHQFPYMNARLSADGSAIERLPFVNLGMAVDTERGLLVPVVRDANHKGLRAFGAEFRTLVERARIGKSLLDDLTGGTFTITNLGMFDIDAFTPIINLPEAAILGVGRIQPKAVVKDGEIVARQMWTLSLAFDHRLVDGTPAARFLQRIKQFVENPFLLLG